MQGHLFVIQGDLTKLACDAILIPCDSDLNVSDVWEPLLTRPTKPGMSERWHTLEPMRRIDSHIDLPPLNSERGSTLVAATAVVDSTDPIDAETVAQRVENSIAQIRPQLGSTTRAIPLVGLPLFGTGDGGLSLDRGLMIETLLPALSSMAIKHSVDIALVLHDRRDYAATQARRAPMTWGQSPLSDAAGRVAKHAANGNLSVFIGAGLSIPLGLPGWTTLLDEMARDLKCDIDPKLSLLNRAQAIKTADPTGYEQWLGKKFTVSGHALGHALVAAIAGKQMVTTNYDGAMEMALNTILGTNGYDVMTKAHASAARPWLLKLHGDAANPATIVLTAEDYGSLREDHNALQAVVASLMLTSHLLFVGFSLTDEDFLDLAPSVVRVRRLANGSDSRAGTAISLAPDEIELRKHADDPGHAHHVDLAPHLDLVSIGPADDMKAASRNLEIFLDQVAWTVAHSRPDAHTYLLDQRYATAFTNPSDIELRTLLNELVNDADQTAKNSRAWPVIERALRDLGLRS